MKIMGRTVSGRIVAIATAAALGAGILGGAAVNAASVATGVPIASAADAARQTIAKILAPLVTNGVINQAQADAVVKAIESARPQRPAGTPFGPFGPGGPGAFGFRGVGPTDASAYLGLTADQMRTQLQAGKSLGEIADATAGKSRAGLVDTLTKAGNARIDQAVTAGKLTAEQAATAKAKVTASVTQLVDHKGTAGPKGMAGPADPRGNGGPFGHRGPRPSGSPTTN